MRGRSQFHRKTSIGAVLATFVAVGVFGGFLLVPRQANAQLGAPIPDLDDAVNNVTAPTTAAAGTTAAANTGASAGIDAKNSAWDALRISLTNTAAVAVLNGLNYFAQKVAYDTAVYVASGGKGQVPLIFDRPGTYFKQVGADAAGEVLGTLTKDPATFGKYGVNLCMPTTPRIALNLKLGFVASLPSFGVGSAPTPKCTWDSITTNWDSFTSQSSAEVLDNVGAMFSPGESSLAAAIEVNNVALKEINLRKYTAGIEQAVGDGFKPVVDKISGTLKTPASTVKKTFEYSVDEGFKVKDNTTQITAGAFGAGALGVLTASLKTFAGALTTNLTKKVFESGFISVSDILGLHGDTNLTFDAAAPLGGRATAELANASLLTPNILTVGSYNELLEFASCPNDGRTPNNCVIDQQFFGALSRAEQGATVTLRQAVEQGYVQRGWQLLPLAHQKNLQGNCQNEAFCYSNLVKLRRARIIPIGWELAANSPFNDISRPVTLGEAMDRFHDCPMTTDANGDAVVDEARLPDPLHPWCHLIDPEWVLKYPAASCRQRGPGPTLVSQQSAARASVCADVATCIAEDASGNCVGGYGYCVREKAVWRLDADACPAQYASCTTYQRAGGGQFSYLSNTLDAAACNSQNAGCRQYAISSNAVPNSGFEDMLGDEVRDWTLSAAARIHRGGRLSFRGSNAVGVTSGASASVVIKGLLPGTSYRLSASVTQELENTSAVGTVRLELMNKNGAPIATPVTLDTGCRIIGSGDAVELDISSSSLGYLTGSCEIVLPADATEARLTIASDAPAGNRTWFDEIGLFGDSFSASPHDTVFMNAKAERCANDQAGCTQFVRLATGTLNLVRNGGFEEEDGDLPLFWQGTTASRYENATLLGHEGISAYALSMAPIAQDIGGIIADASYSFSMFSRRDGEGSVSGTARIQLFDANIPPAPVSPVSADGCSIVGTALVVNLAAGAEYALSECRFTTPGEAGSATITLTASAAAPRLLTDAIQLELAVASTPFHEGYSSGAERVFLKKAPEGLDCSGSEPPPECARYAPSCAREEVGCNSYRPVDGGFAIPAVTTGADACPAECVGYDTFRQEPSNFSDAKFPLFLIPSTAQRCTAAEAGCSEFTNIERLAAGGEAREYYSYLRLCAAPSPLSSTFYTWEGNEGQGDGLRLRSWSLLRSNIAAAEIGPADPTGGTAPCTKLGYDVAGQAVCADDPASVQAASCSRLLVGINPDCREFYDEQGNIHYRLYSKTIVSTDDCRQYRITNTTDEECVAHGGLLRNGECRYSSYAAESVSCVAQAAGCRAYSGNASRNVRVLFTDTFESLTTDGWGALTGANATDVSNSNESVAAAGHSLKIQDTATAIRKDVGSSVRAGRQYILTFWAKGTGDLTARFSAGGDGSFTLDRLSGLERPVALTTEWRPYQVGPVELLTQPSAIDLLIERLSPGASPAFLDNIELREVSENIYLVEGSWDTPLSCDQSPAGDASPQYMLGCRAYADKDNLRANLKSFAKLCRPEAVGCEALYDTRNSESPFAQTFNAVCTLGTPCAGLACSCAVDGKEVCQVGTGATTCRYDADHAVATANTSPTGDTVRVAADGIAYLVNDARFRCDASNMGCTELGARTMAPDRLSVQGWSATTLKNLPSSYGTTLCKSSEEFCQAYTRRADGAQVYFKDPDTRVCEFREGATQAFDEDGNLVANGNGWFRKGSDVPCDADFLEAGTKFGIWKNSDALYDGWAGTCDARYDMCKEFIDPEDRSSGHVNGKPYYAIMNARLDTQSCQGRASLQRSPSGAEDASACVLFWQTDDLKKTYDAAATYAKSADADGALVTPVSGTDNTANVIIRVKRDRQCGEWLDCRSSESVFNPSTGQYQSVCTAYSLCAEYERVGNLTRCVRYVESSFAGRTLSQGVYAARDVSWEGMDYSGYGIPNRYPVEELVTVNVGTSAERPDLRLVRSIGTCTTAYGSACGPVGNRGTCLGPSGQRQCVYPIDGGRLITEPTQLRQAQLASGYPGASCRIYPQENAPFPSTVADPSGWNIAATEMNNGNPTLVGPSPAFSAANVCQRRLVNGVEVSTCECSYFIARYGGATKYFPAESEDIPSGYCTGGIYENYECDPLARGARSKNNLSCCSKTVDGGGLAFDSGCVDGAQCVKLAKIDRVVGYEGQCLERDFTSPINGRSDQFACVTWRPVGLVGGSRDIYNQHQTAGYFAPPDRRFYCVGAHPGWTLQFDIPALNKDTPSHDDNYGDGKVTPESASIFDTNGDGKLDPRDLEIMKFFGPGTIKGATAQSGSRIDCEKVGDESGTGGWCIWPGVSNEGTTPQLNSSGATVQCPNGTGCASGYECTPPVDGGTRYCVSKYKVYDLQHQALGILGCYEIADGGSVDQQYIEWPYIGPPLYRQQLASVYFQITDDIYDWTPPLQPGEVRIRDSEVVVCPGDPRCRPGTSGEFTVPTYADLITNPYQNVVGDCNDESDDNIDNEDNDHIDSSPVSESDIIDSPDKGRGKSVFHLTEENGWKVDVSDSEGVILLSASFDANGLLAGLKLAASDADDEGAFGINRLGFQFKPGCEQIAQVDETGEFGATVAFTNSVNPYRDFVNPNMTDVYGDGHSIGDACRPYGALGAVTAAPTVRVGGAELTRTPWTYVAHRGPQDLEQCTDRAFLTGVTYELGAPVVSDLDSWFNSIRRLFRRVFSLWTYERLRTDGTRGGYVTATNVYDERSVVDSEGLIIRGRPVLGGDIWHPPRIASLATGPCEASGSCKFGRMGAVSINGRDQGTVLGTDGSMNVSARFFAWASHDSMPIASRTVLWGDFTPNEPPAKGWYKNQKPYCSPDTSDENAIGQCGDIRGLTCNTNDDCPLGVSCEKGNNAFGNTPGACTAAPYQFEHTYTCGVRDLNAMPLCTGPADAATNAPCYRLVSGSPVCIYRPKVQIVDNWGWCNCTGTGCEESGGAHGADCALAGSPADARPWTEFGGEVRLAPTVADALAASPGSAVGGGIGGFVSGFIDTTFGSFIAPPTGAITSPPILVAP